MPVAPMAPAAALAAASAAGYYAQQQAQAQQAAQQYAASLHALGLGGYAGYSGAGGAGAGGGAGGSGGGAGEKRSFVRMQADSTWVDPTLADWPEGDFRLYVTDLGPEATDELLAAQFRRWASFARARVVRDKYKPDKVKGYGFVSFLDPYEALAALKEKQGAYCGGRPMKLQRSKWNDKDVDVAKAKEKEREKRRLTGGV